MCPYVAYCHSNNDILKRLNIKGKDSIINHLKFGSSLEGGGVYR